MTELDRAFFGFVKVVIICVITFAFGLEYGQNEIYESLYGDKLECKLTADAFIQELNVTEEEK